MKKTKDMKRTLLKFSSAVYLLAFRKFSKAKHWEINLHDLTVICDCSEKEARIACIDFMAVILNKEEEVTDFGKPSHKTNPLVLAHIST